ncbi:centrosomal protein of 120 kDa-like [Symsagittifera roscoffensis]|uniref:centrosomal protein of 120 kDa-like n=1 Tax=Symsagittifera roscoffensis TaxID=84072 RepID=UPI00307C4514
MVENKQYLLIVVSVQAGRFFPKRNRWKLCVEAKFDGEHLSTDPVDHVDTPEIGTELAWEIDKKSFRQHRLNRTPIKLQVFAVDVSSQQKEFIGLVMIDLKKADQKPMQSQWYPLLNCSYSNSRPEIKVGIMLENEKVTQANTKPEKPAVQLRSPTEQDANAARKLVGDSPTISTDRDFSSKHTLQHEQQSDRLPQAPPFVMPGSQTNNHPNLLNPELCQMIHTLVGSSSHNNRGETKPMGGRGEQGLNNEQQQQTEIEGDCVGRHVQIEDTDDLRATSEYQVALELQLWKEQQQQLFLNQMKVKESERMKALCEEWKRRDMERELVLKQKMADTAEMEHKLHTAIAHIEKREKLLTKNEAQLEQQKVELTRECEKKNSEMSDACARMEKDCLHKIELEKEKRKFVEEELAKVKSELLGAERRVREKESEFEHFRQQLDLKPEVRLQAQINVLTLEKVELERKVEALSSSKTHYKQEWGRALKELFKLKQTIQTQQEAELRKEKQQLEHMRLVHMAAEERKLASKEKDEIEELKLEITKLKDMQSSGKSGKGGQMNSAGDGAPDFFNQSNDELESHVTRLIEERDTLLRTGVYNSSDKIIADLDKQIRDAIAAKVS